MVISRDVSALVDMMSSDYAYASIISTKGSLGLILQGRNMLTPHDVVSHSCMA
jgi:alpha-D-ribose 1-methylphosphonate 5-triphosphate diphosphatase PhnM